jgi:hypothetical protein
MSITLLADKLKFSADIENGVNNRENTGKNTKNIFL